MVGLLSPKRRFGSIERGFEYSRLHDEWMAAVYALVLIPGPGGRRCERTKDAAYAKHVTSPSARRHHKEGKTR